MARIALRSLVLSINWLAVAALTVAVTQSLGHALAANVPTWTWAPQWLASAATWLGKPAPPEMNYQPVVTAALAVIGTLAGVYFATVAFVISTTYKDATTRVRSLVTRLPEGRVYAFVYVQAVLFALATLMLPLFGRDPNRLTLSVLAVLGSFVVLSFGRLRSQLYGLLEPAGLLPIVYRDIQRWMRYAVKGRQTGQPWRAQTARRQVGQSLATLRELCRLIRAREHESPDTSAEYTMMDSRVRSAVQTVAQIWVAYASRKHRLIALPGWCGYRERHKDWLLASDFEVGVALGTSTTLQADRAEDQLWLERTLCSVLADLLGGRTASQYSNLAGDFDQLLRVLMSVGLFNDARLWLEAVVYPAMPVVAAQTAATAPSPEGGDYSGRSDRGSRLALAHEHNLADFVMLSVVQVVLGVHDYAAALTRDFPEWTSKQADGQAARRLGHRPTELFANIVDGLAFERAAEGRRITSDANVYQLAALSISTELIDELTGLVDALEERVAPWVHDLCKTPSYPAAAAAARFDEVLHKATDVLIPSLERCFAACEDAHRDVDDRWPDLDLSVPTQRLTQMKRELRLPIARLASHADTHLDPDRPDIFGWAFHRAHEDLLDDVLDPDVSEDLTARLLLLVSATDRAGSRLQTTLPRTHVRVANSYRAEPMLMLLQLSGIAYVVDRFDGRAPLFDTFAGVWRPILSADPQRVLDTVLASLASDDLLFGVSPGKMTRSGRQQRASASLNFLEPDSLSFRPRRRRRRSDSSGADAGTDAERAIANHLGIHGDFEDVFIAAWLLPEAMSLGASSRPDLIHGLRLEHLIDDLASANETDGASDTADIDDTTRDSGDGP